jgi:hypothetical protein
VVAVKVVHPTSLAKTIDAINEAFFFGLSMPKNEKKKAALWIVARQGQRGAYGSMFAPTEKDFREGIRLFTGERITSNAAIGHILGEEACRSLILLNIRDREVYHAMQAASHGMLTFLYRAKDKRRGYYCCGACTDALWRHLSVGGLDHAQERLRKGIRVLRQHRDGTGRWRSFPFYYTLLALSEIELPGAYEEMRYAAKTCEALQRRLKNDGKISQRRRSLIEKVLAKC